MQLIVRSLKSTFTVEIDENSSVKELKNNIENISFFPSCSRSCLMFLSKIAPEESIAGLKTQMFFFEKLNTSLKPISLLTTDKDKDLEFVVKEVMTYLYKNWY